MSPIRVNADYESVLFLNQSAPAIVNQSLEFLAFYLDDRPVLTSKKYSKDYLEHVESLIGRKIQLASAGESINWWGELKNISLEQKLNSKLTSTEVLIQQNWIEDLMILKSQKDFNQLDRSKIWLLKNPFLMSGQKFHTLFPNEELNEKNLSFPLIAEPLLGRSFDFSHYFFSDESSICYENIVDNRFQYKGTKFADPNSFKSLSFYNKIDQKKWDEFLRRLDLIASYYKGLGAKNFSVDSFIYKKEGELFIYPMCEINARKTMGSCAFEIYNKFKKNMKFGSLYLKKSSGESFKSLLAIEDENENVFILSPGDTRFNIYLILANSEQDLQTKIKLI